MVHTRYDNRRTSFIHSFIHRSTPKWWEGMRSCPIGYDGNVLSFPTWRNKPFQEITNIPPPPPPARWFFTFFQLLLNTGFHRITLGQSDSAPADAPSIHWMPKHRFPLDHTGPEWFSTHWRTIHPLDAWTCCGWTWTSPVPSPPMLAHQLSVGYSPVTD